ncbi:hypothetical protein HOD96_01285 [Candidatus Falkowbacteria bacterium]|jgi:nanoRNase/pAp phosphatase (c-di-AMP/oligoRNAs hydrolase)|nr:hypothetical protein [Candidatus Falkowbacteria bacterium]MBT4433037.1 hypothetical protein [Candidatus Falkowbacteria bacterium]
MLEINEQILSAIKKSNNILIAFRKNYNGDSIGSALSLYLFLKTMDKNIDMVCDNFQAEDKFQFLDNIEKINSNIKKEKTFTINLNTSKTDLDSLRYEQKENSIDIIIEPKTGYFEKNDVKVSSSLIKYDLIFVLDSQDLESLGKIFEDNANFFYNTPIVNIDHHPGNESFGQINLVNLTASSTSEIVFSLLKEINSPTTLNEKQAESLLTGIIDCTNSFKSLAVTPKTLTDVASLIDLGADREHIIKNLYQIYSVDNLKLWGRVLARLKENENKELVWSLVTSEDFAKTNTSKNHLVGVIDELIINMPKIKLVALFYQEKDKEVKVIIKNKNKVDLMSVLSKYNPVGDNLMATVSIPDKGLIDSEKEITEILKNAIAE